MYKLFKQAVPFDTENISMWKLNNDSSNEQSMRFVCIEVNFWLRIFC